MTPWHRTFNIVKEVSKGQVLLRIPFYTIPVQDLKVESWHFTKKGNELLIRLEREEKGCLLEKMLEEKRIAYQFAVYPGERPQ
jgi:hypothetical protein